MGPHIFGETSQQSSAAGPYKNNQSVCQCCHCWGWGHMAKECAIPLNYSKGGVSMFLPPKSGRPKGAEISTDQAQTNPTILKAVKECYHNPDPMAHLIGEVNEAHILVEDVNCLALVDLGAQLSTLMIEFVKQLGLKIHQLDRI